MTDIAKLLERVRAATGPDRELDWRVAEVFDIPEPWRFSALWPPFGKGSKFEKSIPSFTSSVDAALALVERKLPGTLISLTQMVRGWQASIVEPDPEAPGMVMNDHFADGGTAPLAILAALLSALSSGDAS